MTGEIKQQEIKQRRWGEGGGGQRKRRDLAARLEGGKIVLTTEIDSEQPR